MTRSPDLVETYGLGRALLLRAWTALLLTGGTSVAVWLLSHLIGGQVLCDLPGL